MTDTPTGEEHEGGVTGPRDFRPSRVMSRLYPEVGAGGFTRIDGFVEFYSRVNSLMNPDSHVLDFGAGRGSWASIEMPAYLRTLRSFHERVARVVGADVDPAVLQNPHLAERQVLSGSGPLPWEDDSFDIVVADHVFEHITASDAPRVASELLRVLRPGGWLAARTPNKWGMIGLAARVVPNDKHTKVLTVLQPGREAQDVFPVQYSMNTKRDLRRLFPSPNHTLVYAHSSEPRYFGESSTAWRLAALAQRLTPRALEPTLMVFVRKAT